MGDRIRVLSFGAGVQSTTLLYLALNGEIEPFDYVLFSDTGWEPRAVYAHLWKCAERCADGGVPLLVVSKGNIRDDIMSAIGGSRCDNPPFFTVENGSRGMLYRKCTRHYKSGPLDKHVTAIRRAHEGVEIEQVFGISLDEIQRMRVSRRKGVTYSYPLAWDMRWTRARCEVYLMSIGIEPVKSACLGCPYHSNAEWRRIRDDWPDEWDMTCELDDAIRDGVGGSHSAYLHRSGVALRNADLSTPEDHGQGLLGFVNECDGMCGV